MSGKVFVFPGSADPYEVKLKTSKNSFGSLTSCLRYKTDQTDSHPLLSLSTTSNLIGFYVLVSEANKITLTTADTETDFNSLDLAGNTWHRICATWCSDTGLGQLWLNGKPTIKKSTSSGSVVSGSPEFTLGTGHTSAAMPMEFTFVGMISDVHTWDYVLSPTELQHYMDDTEFITGNVHNWRALDFSITGKVLEEEDLILSTARRRGKHIFHSKMEKTFLITLMLAASCVATKDLTGKVFVFPVASQRYHVKLFTDKTSFIELTACLRFKSDLERTYALVSLAVDEARDAFGLYVTNSPGTMTMVVPGSTAEFKFLTLLKNTWHSICATWSSTDSITQLWLDGKPTVKKATSAETATTGTPDFILGQGHEDPTGLKEDENLVGMMSDVHVWDYVLSKYEIKRFMEEKNFTPGNVHNWKALTYEMTGQVMLEDKIDLM
ncbi:uncharacterized protein LOC128746690 [Synchiropus splendidus]|uniref:uncharacterized protein LOC128746690 n=1 Tax=Synchiropus splendidus TaxID=270530 RepID=UPI00237EBE36|nr:uncharacterized protein LOC128746690 [Synchiropus splendidus]